MRFQPEQAQNTCCGRHLCLNISALASTVLHGKHASQSACSTRAKSPELCMLHVFLECLAHISSAFRAFVLRVTIVHHLGLLLNCEKKGARGPRRQQESSLLQKLLIIWSIISTLGTPFSSYRQTRNTETFEGYVALRSFTLGYMAAFVSSRHNSPCNLLWKFCITNCLGCKSHLQHDSGLQYSLMLLVGRGDGGPDFHLLPIPSFPAKNQQAAS